MNASKFPRGASTELEAGEIRTLEVVHQVPVQLQHPDASRKWAPILPTSALSTKKARFEKGSTSQPPVSTEEIFSKPSY